MCACVWHVCGACVARMRVRCTCAGMRVVVWQACGCVSPTVARGRRGNQAELAGVLVNVTRPPGRLCGGKRPRGVPGKWPGVWKWRCRGASRPATRSQGRSRWGKMPAPGGGAPREGGGPRPGGARRRGGDQGALGLSGACGCLSPGRWDCGEGPGWRVLCGRVITDVASAPPAPPRVAAVQGPSVRARDPPPRTHLLAPAARSFLRRRAASSCALCALLILAVRRLSLSGQLEFGVTRMVRGGRGMTSRTRS